MIASHFDSVRDAMQMSPSSSLCMAALWAATWATPPAPTISTLCFIMSPRLFAAHPTLALKSS